MHPAVVAIGFLTLCALFCRIFRHCARSQRDVLLDRERGNLQLVPARFSYRPLPTTSAYEATV